VVAFGGGRLLCGGGWGGGGERRVDVSSCVARREGRPWGWRRGARGGVRTSASSRFDLRSSCSSQASRAALAAAASAEGGGWLGGGGAANARAGSSGLA